MKIIDISVSVEKRMLLWPKTPRPRLLSVASISKGDAANEMRLDISVHTGTHIDAPLHFLSKGGSIDTMSLKKFMGPAFVARVPKVKAITAKHLDKLKLPKGIDRLLLRTSNSKFWGKRELGFQKNYVGLTSDAASWLAKRGMQLVGVDYLSVAKFDEIVPVHRILLTKKIALLEGINLNHVKQGVYYLICLPMKISNLEAAPVRAILIKK